MLAHLCSSAKPPPSLTAVSSWEAPGSNLILFASSSGGEVTRSFLSQSVAAYPVVMYSACEWCALTSARPACLSMLVSS
jgi:hypothetical protein